MFSSRLSLCIIYITAIVLSGTCEVDLKLKAMVVEGMGEMNDDKINACHKKAGSIRTAKKLAIQMRENKAFNANDGCDVLWIIMGIDFAVESIIDMRVCCF